MSQGPVFGRRISDYGLDVALGNVPGVSKVNKFGSAPDCDSGVSTDVWGGADGATSTDIWVAPTQARIHALVSASDADSDTGGTNPQSTGMRTCRVFGLQDWDSVETSEDVILDGTEAVNTVESYVIIHRVVGLTFGGGATNAGIIKATAATDATITAVIQAGESQTFMAIYGVPSTQTIHLTDVVMQVLKTVGATVEATGRLVVQENADQANTGFVHKERYSFSEVAPMYRAYGVPKSFAGPCIVKIQVETDTNDSIVIAAFDAYVVDN